MFNWPWSRKEADATLDEKRRANDVRLSDLSSWNDVIGSGLSTMAGPVVNEDTAMRLTAVYACVDRIASSVGMLPLEIYRRSGQGRERVRDHAYYEMLHDAPNDRMTSSVFWEGYMVNKLLAGDGIGLFDRTYGGKVLGIHLVPSRHVSVELRDGRLRYSVWLDQKNYEVFDQDDVIHVPCLGWKNNRGLSPIANCRETLGLGMASDDFGSQFFSNGPHLGGVIRYPHKKVSADQAEEIRHYWRRKHQGIDNAGLPAILSEGGEFQSTTLSAADAQLIESRQFNVVEIARLFGVPPWMIGATEKTTSWGSGIEQQSIGFVTYTLNKHLTKTAKELNRKLFRGTDFFCEFNADGLLRGDYKTRFEGYRIARGGNQEPGFMTVNEIRRRENLPPVAGGDELYRPQEGAAKENQLDKDGEDEQTADQSVSG